MRKLVTLLLFIILTPVTYAVSFDYIKQSLEQAFPFSIIVLVIALIAFILTLINYLHTRTQLKELMKITEQFKVDYVHDKEEHLKNYIKFCRNLKYKDKKIVNALKKVGWQE